MVPDAETAATGASGVPADEVNLPQEARTGDRTSRGGKMWLKVLVAALAAVGFVVALRWLPLVPWMQSFSAWVEHQGLWGQGIYALLYILCTVLFVPGTLLTFAAGALYRVVVGTVVISIGSTLGAAAAFLVGRYFLRSRVEGWVAGNPKFAAIDRAVGEQGWKIVLLTRLSPIFPFNLLNYAFGLTRVNFWSYFLASWIGMLPGTILFVYVGQLVGDLSRIFAGEATSEAASILGNWPTVVGLVVAGAVSVYVGAIARRALKQVAPGDPPAQRQER